MPFDFIKDKFQSLKEDTENYNLFKKSSKCRRIKILKSDRKVEFAFIDETSHKLYFYKNVKVFKYDFLVDEREIKYCVTNINYDDELTIENKKLSVLSVDFCTPNDERSMVEYLSSFQQNVNQNVTINITTISNSQVSDFGKNFSQALANMDVREMHERIDHDLDYRFDSSSYKKLREELNVAVAQKDAEMAKKIKQEKWAERIGGLLGIALQALLSKLLFL